MAGVARVPVVVAGVTVEQGISAAAHALDDAGTRRHCSHVLAGNCRGLTQSRASRVEESCVCVCVVVVRGSVLSYPQGRSPGCMNGG